MSSASNAPTDGGRPLPPVLGRLMRGSFWLALRTPLQAVLVLWSVPLTIAHIGEGLYGAYGFAWGFGFLQFLLEFGISSALNRQVAEAYTRGDRGAVDRTIACGMSFYAATAVLQAAALVAIAYLGLPYTRFGPASRHLIVQLLWLQAATAPCYGLSTVVSGVLQAARRYEIIPRLELAVIVVRFALLYAGLSAGVDFFRIVVAQTAVQVALTLGPALWVMVRELGYRPHFGGATWADFRALLHVSAYMFLIQLSVVLADRMDTTILGFALAEPDPAIARYRAVSTPFLQVRQTGWMLTFLVMPAVASLRAARDERGLEKLLYDGSRYLIGLLLPMGLLAAIYAHPFLALWVPWFAGEAPLMQLFLVAAIPLAISVLVQAAIGSGRIRPIALAALGGAVVNLPISYALTLRIGLPGVIWGTVLTTLFSNLLIPGIYVFRVLRIRPATFLRRTLVPPLVGAAALMLATWALRLVSSAEPPPTGPKLLRAAPLASHVVVGLIAYLAGYLATPAGRGDMAALRRRSA